jgi:single-stranded-DNA-specific exonuclease
MVDAMPRDLPDPAFLGVAASLTGQFWTGPGAALERAADTLAQRTGHPLPLCQVLARVGLDAAGVPGHLAPRLKDLLPDPRRLRDAEKAAERLQYAVERTESIAVFADYDVDGGASAALLLRWLRVQGIAATLYVPDRIDEGYGPNAPAIRALAESHDLIICVDCGTLSHDALAAATGLADVVVLDHHQGAETLPPALAVVNPNRQDESGDLGHLCAAAVVFLVLVETNRRMRDAGCSVPDLIPLLDLVGLATVADVAPLIGVNRAFVRQGLAVMAKRGNAGLVALAEVARLDSAPSAYHLGYVLGPRINAGGRIGRADLGARLLATDSAEEAQALAARLDTLNAERREVEASVRAAALAQVEARGAASGPLVWAAGEGWHPGVVGIVAARLKEATGRPAVVIGFDGDAGKGSGRSVPGIDLGAAIQRLARDGVIERGGGHRMAAGVSLSRAQLEPAMARLADLLDRQGATSAPLRRLRLDGLLLPGAVQPELIERLDSAGPWGAAMPAPRFALPDCVIHDAHRVGDTHLKLSISDGVGARLDAIAFGAFDSDLGTALLTRTGRTAHLAGRLELNHWNGRSRAQLRLEDAALPGA